MATTRNDPRIPQGPFNRGLIDAIQGPRGPNDPRSRRAVQQANATKTPGENIRVNNKGKYDVDVSALADALEMNGTFVAGYGTAFPATIRPGVFYLWKRSDEDDVEFSYDQTRQKWLAVGCPEIHAFGHSSSIGAGVLLRVVGLSSSGNATYVMPYDATIVAWTYTRSDFTSSAFEIMINASTVLASVSSSATEDSSSSVDLDVSIGDNLWIRVASGAANPMTPNTFITYLRRRAS